MAFLLFVLVASALGISIVLIRNRRPTSMEASIAEFERTLGALAPEAALGPRRLPAPDDPTKGRAEARDQNPG